MELDKYAKTDKYIRQVKWRERIHDYIVGTAVIISAISILTFIIIAVRAGIGLLITIPAFISAGYWERLDKQGLLDFVLSREFWVFAGISLGAGVFLYILDRVLVYVWRKDLRGDDSYHYN